MTKLQSYVRRAARGCFEPRILVVCFLLWRRGLILGQEVLLKGHVNFLQRLLRCCVTALNSSNLDREEDVSTLESLAHADAEAATRLTWHTRMLMEILPVSSP